MVAWIFTAFPNHTTGPGMRSTWGSYSSSMELKEWVLNTNARDENKLIWEFPTTITEISILIKSMYSTWMCIYTLMLGWRLSVSLPFCLVLRGVSLNYDPTQVTSLKWWKSGVRKECSAQVFSREHGSISLSTEQTSLIDDLVAVWTQTADVSVRQVPAEHIYMLLGSLNIL